MPERGLTRFVPLIVLLLLILALAVVYGPGTLRAWKFRTTVNAMLADIKGGKVRSIPNYVLPDQKQAVTELVMNPVVSHYAAEIGSLKLTSYRREDSHIWAIVTAKLKDGSIGQGNLRWVWNGKLWQFDTMNSFVAPGIVVREEEAWSIGEMIENAKNKKPPVDEEAAGL